MTNQDLIEIGFKELPHYTITDVVLYDLGHNRFLSAGCVGTPNEILFLEETSEKNPTEITDIIVLHNYDYCGELTIEKVKELIKLLKY